MNYKLAKQLKDAGFPETTRIGFELNLHRYVDVDGISHPFLQELIGELSVSWMIALDPNYKDEKEKYIAIAGQYDGIWEYTETGGTLEEAVAKLLLKLLDGRKK